MNCRSLRLNPFGGHPGGTIALLFSLLFWGAGDLSAQSVGLELGLAGIENYDPVTPAAGISLHVPVLGRVSASATYARWTGRDGNEAFRPPGISRLGYGNHAVLLTGLVRLFDPDGLSASVGAGVGWFQHFALAGGEEETVYDSTPMGTLVVHYRLTPGLSPYLRADVQIPTEPVLHYGLARLGLDIKLP